MVYCFHRSSGSSPVFNMWTPSVIKLMFDQGVSYTAQGLRSRFVEHVDCYADPEDYYPQKDENIFQKISEKSDVYSFIVVLLELITGRTIFDEHRVDIVNWAKPFMFKGYSVEINYSCLVDSALKGDYIKSEMKLMIYCAAVSVYKPSKLRPRMKQIVEALEGKMPSNELWVAEVNQGYLAFVDNEFKAVWVADSQGLRIVYESKGPDNIFSPVWNQDPQKDTLYVCMGPSFNSSKTLDICAIPNVSSGARQRRKLTRGFNNAFPSTSPDGTRLVFRSTRDGAEKKYKNLYIMEDAEVGEYGNGKITRLTNGQWTDTHCQWSPTGDWIVFSSTRDKPDDAPETDNYLDPGYFAVPDGKSIAVTAEIAAVSVDPISLPMFLHSVRPYGDVFTVDIDPYDINKNKDVKKFNRIT
ncbi:hypothetical protein GH714_024665 [Hevea brasiliensis]|uniref:Protein kinase domain-containing protein n=1 Tax=Hevea brasiliensis TaxID=3981 RepID=A0A6A6N1S7_HEVBR|nr:hypothetical protein GH714_024665 [Hevea brasiliensis]